jgi:ribosomal protein S18 acetylase RimI-like enzyme
MGKLYDGIDADLADFIGRQHVFFVGTTPTSPEGHLNLSPKGLDTFRILGPNSVAYLDLTGSGIETVAHLRENGRITIMFCAFEGHPLIVRLYGRGRVVEPGDPEWGGLIAGFPRHPGARSVVVVDVERVADSCGFAVPLYAYQGERTQLIAYAERKGPDGLAEYRAEKNRASIDGMAGLRSAGGDRTMQASDPTIHVTDATDEVRLDHARHLFRSYAAEFADSIAESLCFQGFDAELAGLPGRYAPPSGDLLLAMEGDRPAGCVAMRDLGGGTCEMKRLYVAPDYRGRGVGRLLVEALIRRAERAGYRRMVLDTLPEMAGALALYREHGFVETARYWDNPIERSIYLERPLARITHHRDGDDNGGSVSV